LESEELESQLIIVLGKILQFSEEEIERVKAKRGSRKIKFSPKKSFFS
jgi:hypothetical protein